MRFHMPSAEIFVPDGLDPEPALARTTHLAIAAHQDDIEIMAAAPILECFQQADRWFSGVVVTDGRGSPRAGAYELYNDEEMRQIRLKEQRKAAVVGEYAAQILLDYSSHSVKDTANQQPVEDLSRILELTQPQFIYTHNLTDKHDTHVAVALRVMAALRALPKEIQPLKVYGCEVWRGLDWMLEEGKEAFDLSLHENLQAALLGVFDSQISGGKRYDLASLGRRRANATYHESHDVDAALGISYAMDLTPLVEDLHLDVLSFVQDHIDRFAQDVAGRINRVG